MAEMVARMKRVHVQGDLLDMVNDAIQELGQGREIVAAITVPPGFERWWFLEYGTSPATPSPDPDGNDPVQLQVPTGLKRKSSHQHGAPYLIKAKRRAVASTFGGGRMYKRAWLRYYSRAKHRWVRAPQSYHPGILPRNFVRPALEHAYGLMMANLADLLDNDVLPTRRELCAVVNQAMEQAYDAIVAATPVQQPPPPYDGKSAGRTQEVGPHLKDAWGFSPAR